MSNFSFSPSPDRSRSLSPKRKASQPIGSPSKRATLDLGAGIEIKDLFIPTGNMIIKSEETGKRTIEDIAPPLQPLWRSPDRQPLDIDSGSSDSNDTVMDVDDDNPTLLHDYHEKQIDHLDLDTDTMDSVEYKSPTGSGGSVDFGDIMEFPLVFSSSESEMSDYEASVQSKDYVELHVTVHVTRCNNWARAIDVYCTYNNEEVASASGHIVYRELIRGNFFPSMDKLERPISDRIDEILDHHGYFRWSIKEHYNMGQDDDRWDYALDTGSILQIDEILVAKEWRSQPLGALMVTSLVDRAVKRDCAARFAFVLPSTGCFWKVDNTGVEPFDKTQSWAEQNHVCLFLGVGFVRVAETDWYVLDLVEEVDRDPGCELKEDGESKYSEHTVLMSGALKC